MEDYIEINVIDDGGTDAIDFSGFMSQGHTKMQFKEYLARLVLRWIPHYDFDYRSDRIMETLATMVDTAPFTTSLKPFFDRKKQIKDYTPSHKWMTTEILNEILSLISAEKIARDFDDRTPLLETTQTLTSILDLTVAESLFLDFAIRSTEYGHFVNEMFGAFSSYVANDGEAAEFYNVLLGIDKNDYAKFKEGILIKTGILVERESFKNIFALRRDFMGTFTKPNLTLESLANDLFPSGITTSLTIEDYAHLDKHIQRTEKIINKALVERRKGVNILLWGNPGTGKTEMCLAIAKRNNWTLRVIGDNSAQDMDEKNRAMRLISLKIAMKLYSNDANTVLLFDEFEDLVKMDLNANFSKAFINRIIENTPVPIIWTTNDLSVMDQAILRRMTYNIKMGIPPADTRKKMWEKHLADNDVTLKEETLKHISETFKVAPALISNAAKIASMSGVADDEVFDIISSLDTLVNYGIKQNYENPAPMADTPYDVRLANADIDLDVLTKRLVKAKPNFTIMMAGWPGSGKSEFARYVAKQMGKKVVFRRASNLLGKYLGESEQNIAEAFAQSKKEEAMLIIDEADSLLMDRRKAEHSWEISICNEILSQAENHSQPFVITTNLMENLDPATMRRFVFKVKFDYVTNTSARLLFKKYFRKEAPSGLDRLEVLTPGDFAVVKKKADILRVTNPLELLEMLENECKVKPQHSFKIGF